MDSLRIWEDIRNLIDKMDEGQLRMLAKRMARRMDIMEASSVFGEIIKLGPDGLKPICSPPYQEIRSEVQRALSWAVEDVASDLDPDYDFDLDEDELAELEELFESDEDELAELDEDELDEDELDEDETDYLDEDWQDMLKASICINIESRFWNLFQDILEESGEAEAQNLVTGIVVALKDRNIPWEDTHDDDMEYRRAYADIIQKRFRNKEYETLFEEFDYDETA